MGHIGYEKGLGLGEFEDSITSDGKNLAIMGKRSDEVGDGNHYC